MKLSNAFNTLIGLSCLSHGALSYDHYHGLRHLVSTTGECQQDCHQGCKEYCSEEKGPSKGSCIGQCQQQCVDICVEAHCVRDYETLAAAIYASPNTTTIGNATPPVIKLCPTNMTFPAPIECTNRHFALVCPESNTCTLDGNKATHFFKAGTYSPQTLSSHKVTFQNVDFFQGSGRVGGAIEVYGGTTNLDGCVFDSNYAVYGGAFLGRYFDHVAITHCSFASNAAFRGGAINMGGFGTVQIADSMFSSNSAGSSGGALHLEDSGTVEIDDSTFASNDAGRFGGAIFTVGPTITTITQTNFSGNYAVQDGADILEFYGTVVCNASSNVFCGGNETNYPVDLCDGATYGGCTAP